MQLNNWSPHSSRPIQLITIVQHLARRVGHKHDESQAQTFTMMLQSASCIMRTNDFHTRLPLVDFLSLSMATKMASGLQMSKASCGDLAKYGMTVEY